MSTYPNGQPYYPSYNQNTNANPSTQEQQELQRTSSFNAGDDARFFDQSPGQPRSGYPAYGTNPLTNVTGQSQTYAPVSAHQPTLPYRSGTQNHALGGYQHQYQSSAASGTTYNPAQYQPQSHYNPQTYGSLPATYSNNGYQPYVPAAYQDPNLNRQTSVHNSYYAANSQLPYSQPPALPPRPHELAYGSQSTSYTGYQHEPQSSYGQAHNSSFGSSNMYGSFSTHAPAPPPHQDTIAAARPYTHSFSSSQTAGVSQYGSTFSAQPSPEINRNYSSASRTSHLSNQSSSFNPSPQSSLPTPPSRNPSHHSPQRSNTLDRHPHGRQLPGVPSESESDNDYFVPHSAIPRVPTGFEDIMSNLDAAIGNTSIDPLFETSTQSGVSPDEAPTHLNGVVSTGDHNINYGAFANDSDAEAAAGLAAMQAADEQEAAEEQRRRSGQGFLPGDMSPNTASSRERSDDSDYAGYDLSLAGGGYAGTMSYGGEDVSNYAAAAAAMPAGDYARLNPRMDSVRSTGMSSDGRASQTSGFESIPGADSVHPFPSIRTDIARVDTGGTGGLTEPSSAHPRRLSYEDGDEADLAHDSAGSLGESIPDLFFHPGMSPSRPLPPPPSHSDPGIRLPHLVPAGTSPHQLRYLQYDQTPQHYPTAPEGYQSQAESPVSAVPRSTSLISNRAPVKPEQPMRSKTDADRARLQRQSGRPFQDIYEINSPQSGVALDLPTIPKKSFNPSKITSEQFKKCSEPWALSSILAWIKDVASDETDLKENSIVEAIVSLFTNKVPTMYTTEAEALGEEVVQQMLQAKALLKDEEWVKLGPGDISGVLFQLTGTGCYSAKVHSQPLPPDSKCYSRLCMRTSRKADLTLPSAKKTEDWVTFWKLTKDDIGKYDRKEIERQNIQHEIITGEDKYIAGLDLLRVIYRDQLLKAQPPIISAKKLPGFIRDVFGGVDKIKKVNEEYLLAQLKYRQNEQGPFVVGYSDIFREWIRRARTVYVEYASSYSRADYLMRREAEGNMLFKNFLDQCRNDPRAERLDWTNYLKSPITRMQRYGLLIESVLKNTTKDSAEKSNMLLAFDEVKAANHEADQKLGEAEKKMDLIELASKMKLRKSMEVVELNLDHLGRKVIMRGDLQRASGRGFQMVDTHAILFDHYLVLAKVDASAGRKHETYDVSKTPIPMDLVSLESTNDQAVVKSSMKGIATVTTVVTPRGQVQSDPRLARTTSQVSGSTLTHTNTNTSLSTMGTGQSLVPSTVLEQANSKDDKVLYPFRVKHLGRAEVYTLFASTADVRDQWCQAIISAKQDHAEALYAQNAEPFKLRVLADTAFGIEGYTTANKGVLIRGTPLHRAVQESEARYAGTGRPAPICRATVNCATVFQQPHGRHMCAIGTDYGVYISEYGNPRGWVRAIQMTRVTQISVLEEFNLFLLISDKVLIAYHLDVVCPPTGGITPQSDSSMRKAPQKLSGLKDVGFFVSGKMKDRALVFYKKKDGATSVFKVLEPVLQKSATSRSRFLPTSSKRGQTEFFREYDEFYIPTECYAINLFHSSLAISTLRGVEVLTLDKKQPWSVPNLRSDSPETQAHLSSIASRIKDLKPLGMFRLSQSEFLVTFEECAVYVNQHGDISRGVVMEFVGRAKSACLHEQYLILCDDDFVEIRDAQNGRLKQVIAGKEMRMLDDGGNLMPGSGQTSATTTTPASLGAGLNGLGMQGYNASPKTVKLVMGHPEYEKSYVIVELLFATPMDQQ